MSEALAEVRMCGVATYPPRATFGPRQLREWEFVWMIEGDAHYARTDARGTEQFSAPSGSVLLCHPGQADDTDEFAWDTKRRTRHAYFHFVLRQNPDATWPDLTMWPVARTTSPDDLLLTLFRRVLSRDEDSFARDLAATLLLRLFVTGGNSVPNVAPDAPPEPVARALEFLYARLDADASQPVTLDALARAACVTPEHLCRTFKNATGHTPLETVRLARLDRAATLLARSNFSVGEVGRLCGFASPHHFTRAFRDAFGFAPTELRAQLARNAGAPMPRLLREWRSVIDTSTSLRNAKS